MARKKSTTNSIPLEEAFRKGVKLTGDINVTLGANSITLSHLDKVYWPNDGYSKGDLLRYYYEMSKYVLPYLKDRPLILKRYPNGITKPFFYQHDLKDAPEFLHRIPIDTADGIVHYALADSVLSLLYLANLGTIAQNPFHSRIDNLSCPDYFIFDLDPQPGASFAIIRQVAREVRNVLDEIGLKSYPKTSGSRGIHIYVPIKSDYKYDAIVPFAKEVAGKVAERLPEIATIERMMRNRKRGQVYIDYLQNIEGKSVASAYSVREKPGATVSAPLDWKEVGKPIAIEDFTIKNIARRVASKGDLFTDILTKKQSLTNAMKKLEKLP